MPALSEIHPPDRAAPRYCAERAFPRYRYIPGLHPHPRRDPAGHASAPRPAPADFNAFYFWEAHEAWEGLWAAKPRASAPARLLQGLIQIAAALLKIHLRSVSGAARLSREGLGKVSECARTSPHLMGLALRDTAANFHHYFRPLAERTLPPLDATVPLLLLADPPHA
jgi:hypothetical protein